jgi:hypothetical protein
LPRAIGATSIALTVPTITDPEARRVSEARIGTRGAAASTDGRSSPPSISLPKGGGAIRAIGEKFAGTGSPPVPLATSGQGSGIDGACLTIESGS